MLNALEKLPVRPVVAVSRPLRTQELDELNRLRLRQVEDLALTLDSLMREMNIRAEILVRAWEQHRDGTMDDDTFSYYYREHTSAFRALNAAFETRTGFKFCPAIFELVRMELEDEALIQQAKAA